MDLNKIKALALMIAGSCLATNIIIIEGDIMPSAQAQPQTIGANMKRIRARQALYQSLANKACLAYIRAGYQPGNLERADYNGDIGTVTCHTDQVSFALANGHWQWWARQ